MFFIYKIASFDYIEKPTARTDTPETTKQHQSYLYTTTARPLSKRLFHVYQLSVKKITTDILLPSKLHIYTFPFSFFNLSYSDLNVLGVLPVSLRKYLQKKLSLAKCNL